MYSVPAALLLSLMLKVIPERAGRELTVKNKLVLVALAFAWPLILVIGIVCTIFPWVYNWIRDLGE